MASWRDLPVTRTSNGIKFRGKTYSEEGYRVAAEAFVARAEKLAGRRLLGHELLRGVQHPEDRSELERHQAKYHLMTVTTQSPEVHPFDSYDRHQPRDSPEACTARHRAAYDARIAAEQKKKAIPMSDAQKLAIEHAHELVLLKYDPSVPASIVAKAEAALRAAELGEFNADTYKTISSEVVSKVAEFKAARASQLQQQHASELESIPRNYYAPQPE